MTDFISNAVGFGDNHILRDDFQNSTNSLTVDYGTKNAVNASNLSLLNYFNFTNIFSSGNHNALITHYHTDHYVGFTFILNNYPSIRYNHLYLPKMAPIFVKGTKMTMAAKRIFYSLFLSPKTKYFRNVASDIALFNAISQGNIKKIEFIEKGSTINFGYHQYTVLWPEIKEDFKRLITNDELDNKLMEILNELSLYEEFRKVVDNFNWMYNGEGKLPYRSPETDLYNSFVKLNSKIRNSARYKSLKNQDRFNQYKRVYNRIKYLDKKLINGLSVVFHLPEKILLLGDITKSNFNRYICKEIRLPLRISTSYSVIKASHHGTDPYYSSNLPQAKLVVNSNGKSKGSWSISRQYNSQYVTGKFHEIRCTNHMSLVNCHAYKSGKSCTSCYSPVIISTY